MLKHVYLLQTHALVEARGEGMSAHAVSLLGRDPAGSRLAVTDGLGDLCMIFR